MEKFSLKPGFREILHKGEEPGVFFDVASFSGNTAQEKNLGSIAVLNYLRQKDDDLSYLVSLISSLAKREFYSPQSIAEQDPKAAFERTLKKLNEVLVEYFENKNFTLSIGLAAISGDNIYISRLGKFKVALARDNEYIDILNNVSLFSKDDGDERQFENIVSGKLKSDDKIFAYFPIRTVSTREKILNPLLISENQEAFCDKIDSIAKNAPNFACCGIHINMRHVKEIPVDFSPLTINSYKPTLAEKPVQDPPATAKTAPIEPIPSTNAIRAEVSVAKRENILKIAGSKLFSFRPAGANRGKGFRWLGIIVFTAIVATSGWWLLGRDGGAGDTAIFNQATTSLNLAKSRLAQNETRGARDILRSALAQIGTISDKKIDPVKIDIAKTLDIIDQVSGIKPESVLPESISPEENYIAAGGSAGSVGVYNFKSGKVSDIVLKDAPAIIDAAIYQNNLYVLSGTDIYKFPDISQVDSKKSLWSAEKLNDNSISLAVDGNIYVLAADGKLAQYFKGKKLSEFSLSVTPSTQSKIYTTKDSSFIYLSDISNNRIFVFDKTSGSLKTSYKIDGLGQINGIAISVDGSILLATSTSVYKIKP